tara:strand:+ start:133 stop:345 length:213 start_codon:yes stop_codon:yes gene_type:complete
VLNPANLLEERYNYIVFNQGANMLHHIYYINPEGADYYMIVPFDEIKGTVAFLESLDYEVVAYWPIEEVA